MRVKRARGGASIPCPLCRGRTGVKQTRRNRDDTVRRERTCLACSVVFYTNEKRLRTANGKSPYATESVPNPRNYGLVTIARVSATSRHAEAAHIGLDAQRTPRDR